MAMFPGSATTLIFVPESVPEGSVFIHTNLDKEGIYLSHP